MYVPEGFAATANEAAWANLFEGPTMNVENVYSYSPGTFELSALLDASKVFIDKDSVWEFAVVSKSNSSSHLISIVTGNPNSCSKACNRRSMYFSEIIFFWKSLLTYKTAFCPSKLTGLITWIHKL